MTEKLIKGTWLQQMANCEFNTGCQYDPEDDEMYVLEGWLEPADKVDSYGMEYCWMHRRTIAYSTYYGYCPEHHAQLLLVLLRKISLDGVNSLMDYV